VPDEATTPVLVLGVLATNDEEQAVLEALRSVIDPELGVNLVDLGLVYGAVVHNGYATITLTTTTPTCPLGTYLSDQVEWALRSLPGIEEVEIEVVHSPAWSPAMLSESARRMLGWPG
jgi:metal-sulfur cluster biosynthetic enzyme